MYPRVNLTTLSMFFPTVFFSNILISFLKVWSFLLFAMLFPSSISIRRNVRKALITGEVLQKKRSCQKGSVIYGMHKAFKNQAAYINPKWGNSAINSDISMLFEIAGKY